MQKLQNRAAKLITNSPFDASPLPVIRALGWSTVREIIDLESASIVYKSLNGDAPSNMSDIFTKVNVSTTRSLRNSDYDLRVPFLRTTTGQRCFSYQGTKLRNGLSKKTKNTSTLKNFILCKIFDLVLVYFIIWPPVNQFSLTEGIPCLKN